MNNGLSSVIIIAESIFYTHIELMALWLLLTYKIDKIESLIINEDKRTKTKWLRCCISTLFSLIRWLSKRSHLMFSFPFLSSSQWSFAFVACLTLSNHRLCELCSAPLNSVLDDCWVCGSEKVHPMCWLLYHMCANLCPSLVLYSWLVCQNALPHPKSRWYVLRRQRCNLIHQCSLFIANANNVAALSTSASSWHVL